MSDNKPTKPAKVTKKAEAAATTAAKPVKEPKAPREKKAPVQPFVNLQAQIEEAKSYYPDQTYTVNDEAVGKGNVFRMCKFGDGLHIAAWPNGQFRVIDKVGHAVFNSLAYATAMALEAAKKEYSLEALCGTNPDGFEKYIVIGASGRGRKKAVPVAEAETSEDNSGEDGGEGEQPETAEVAAE